MKTQKTPNNKNYLKRDGQSQKGRFPVALDPLYPKIDERDLKNHLQFAKEYAHQLHFYNSDIYEMIGEIIGTWSPLFDFDPEQIITKIEGYGAHEPHLTLYITFLLLLKHPQRYLNDITRGHLDFYYKDILRFKKKEPEPDEVHVLFDLKKNVDSQLIKTETLLKAGKDKSGAELFYALSEDIIVNRSKVEGLRSVFLDKKNKETVHIAPQANSSDGVGGELDKNEPKWLPFGNKSLPKAELGFALASPVLLLKEGVRTITAFLTLSVIQAGSAIMSTPGNAFLIYLTGEGGWISPKNPSASIRKISDNQYELNLSVILSKDDGAVVNYNPKIHGNNFETSSPLMQVILNTESYLIFKDAVIQKARIEVKAVGIKKLSLENDFGALDPKKPFMPFGPLPTAGSNFYIGYDEAFAKDVKTFSVKIQWKDVPAENLANYYSAYKRNNIKIVNLNSYFKADLYSPDGRSWLDINLFEISDAKEEVTITPTNNYIKGAPREIFNYRLYKLSQQRSNWAKYRLKQFQSISQIKGVLPSKLIYPSPEAYRAKGLKEGFLTLQLKTSFLHKEYREIYTTAIVKYRSGDLNLPNEPYTPVIQSITFDYTATTKLVDLSSTKEDDFLSDELEFFHITAFGQTREHTFQKNKLEFVTDKRVFLLPQYRSEGEFYIGIADLEPLQNLTLLFQVAEGSANPEKEKMEVKWSVLCDNHWKSLDENDVLSDTTNGLLTSGIIKFYIPEQATNTNTILPGGNYWLMAKVDRDTDAICQLLDVRANAVLAQFKDHNNDPEHLRRPLEAGKIKKLSEQIAAIKSVSQPFASFGGKMAEDDISFYSRISERLRHKKRATNIWDYERIVLENFPSIYKVKCISHTCPSCESRPGHVTIVVIPDLKNKNAIDPLKPRVDLNTISEIKKFLSKHSGFFVQLHVENPSYEEITVDFKVSFYKGFEFNYYRGVLNQDIQKFLSPWAFEEGEDIVFGGQIHKSVILYFIEKKCSYVDYVADFKMYHLTPDKDVDLASASNAKAILVSSKNHKIEKA